MPALVKICGLNSPDAIDAAVGAGADWLGFVFFPPSPRAVTPARAAALSARHPPGPSRVGLFVDPSDEDVSAVLAEMPLDVLQVYVPAFRAAALRRRFGLPVWRAVGIASRADLPVSAGGADAVLVEAKAPPGATRPGGNAVAFDWSILANWIPPSPWILAGGLTPDTVADAIAATAAPAVDVSSGVERSPGVKDPALIRRFVAAARGVSRS